MNTKAVKDQYYNSLKKHIAKGNFCRERMDIRLRKYAQVGRISSEQAEELKAMY